MEPSPTFMKARTVAFSCILLASLLWALLLSLVVFFRWEVSLPLERSLVVVMLCANAITVIMVPLLLLLRFRVWLDVARLFFLLALHIGCAASFAYCIAYFICADQSPDQEGICKLINIYILLASWVNPVLLLLYAAGLAFMLYRRSQMAGNNLDMTEEASTSTSLMTQPDKQSKITVPVHGDFAPLSEHRASTVLPWLTTSDGDSRETRSSGHWSKVPPGWSYAI